jgi:hypothetical protein
MKVRWPVMPLAHRAFPLARIDPAAEAVLDAAERAEDELAKGEDSPVSRRRPTST